MAAKRGVELGEALAYARRPRRWLGYEPPKPVPIEHHDNVVHLDAWRPAS